MPIAPRGQFTATASSIGLDPGLAQLLLAGLGSDNMHEHARSLMCRAAERLVETPPAGNGWVN